VIGKDDSGGSTDKDKELDALLSAADRGLLDAIRDNVDLDTGFAQILDDLAGDTPTGQSTGPAEVDPGGRARGYSHAPDPVHAGEVSSAAHRIPAAVGSKGNREPLYYRRALVTLAVAVVAALQIAVLFGLSRNHGFASAQPGATVTNPPSKPIAGEPARGFYFFPRPRMQQLIVLANKAGAFASLRFAAGSAGIGGNPVISYLKDSSSGPVLLLSGLPAGKATRVLSIDADQSCGNCSEVSYWNYPFPSGGEQFSAGTTIYIAGANGRVILKTIQNQSSGQVIVIITWFPDLA
jgi:hypothetical protein